jgi:S1-C subfamily serine protease
VTGLDWVIIGLVLLLALFGWAQGFVAGLLAFLGFAAGALLGTRVAPLVLSEGSHSPYAPVFALMGALLVGAVFAVAFEGLGARVRRQFGDAPAFTAVDGVLGAALTAAVGLGVVWILGALAVSGGSPDLRREVRQSKVLQQLNTILPPSGPLLNALARFDPFPRINGPEVNVAPPRGDITGDPEVEAARGSVVRILGTACGLGVEGSGWVSAPGLVVTNAHVVAGQDDTRVLVRGEGPSLQAQAVAFDSTNDIAVLRVDGLQADPLPIASGARRNTEAAVLGFPRNGPYDVRAARVGETRRVVTQDAYGQGPVTRSIVSLRGLVRSGNSGGPMVDGDGRVVGTVFAATTSGPRGGYAVPNAIVRDALRGASGPVSTGPCTR